MHMWLHAYVGAYNMLVMGVSSIYKASGAPTIYNALLGSPIVNNIIQPLMPDMHYCEGVIGCLLLPRQRDGHKVTTPTYAN